MGQPTDDIPAVAAVEASGPARDDVSVLEGEMLRLERVVDVLEATARSLRVVHRRAEFRIVG